MSINRKRHFEIKLPTCSFCGAVGKHYDYQCPKNPKNQCKYCGSLNHTSLMCFDKPRMPLKSESDKSRTKRMTARAQFFLLNPADESGFWYCYLRISPECPYKLTRETLQIEHVKSKVRYPELRYEPTNLRPACGFCNALKDSLDLEELSQISSIRLPEGKSWADVFEAAGIKRGDSFGRQSL